MRPAFDALFGIDDAMADVVAKATDPTLAAIKLAWWRDRLEGLDRGEVPAEPRLQAATQELLPRGISGVEMSKLEEGWSGLLSYEPPDMALVTEHGTIFFELACKLLGITFDDDILGWPGRLFAGVDAGRRGLIDIASSDPGTGLPRIPRRARPLTALAALAARDLRRGGPPFEPEATPGRALALLRHRWTGRIG